MDVGQFAFLARQPSAALQSRESFWGLPKRGLAFILANMMFWQPLVVMADGIVVNGSGTHLGQAANGVPIVNIAAPNGSGLSHNQFSDYNVGQQGVILNNATNRTQSTQLGGIILGNSGLGGRAANVILNEVNGGSPSQLKGYTEVAGQGAHVIVANPYGITCNGCGFINTPQATLTTGKPVIENGQLQRYQVEQGSVAIEGAGLNASNIDRFEIITRSARINAQIQAKHLALIAGANDVDAQTLEATARAANPADAPQLAIDSSALGGMYAGAIKLVGTEAGVGVKLDGKLIASGGDIQLDADGQLRMVEASAEKGAVAIKAQSLEAQGAVYAGTDLKIDTQDRLTNHKTLAARDSIKLTSGGQLSNQGIIEAGVNADNSRNASGDITLSAQSLDNRGKSLVASRDLSATATQTLNNQGGTLSGQRQVTAKAGTLDNRNQGRVLSGGRADLTASQLSNAEGGQINSHQHLKVQAANLNNQGGQLTSLATLELKAGQVDNRNAGRIASNQALSASVSGLDQRNGGRLTSLGELSLDLNQGDLNNQGGLLSAAGPLRLDASRVENAGGRIASQADLTAKVTGFQQQKGELVAQGNLTLTGSTLDNRDSGLVGAAKALKLDVDQIHNQGGKIAGAAAVQVTATGLDNSGGKLLAGADLGLKVGQLINQSKGLLFGKGQLTLQGQRLDNRDGQLSGQQGLSLLLSGELDNTHGGLSSEGALELTAAGINNSAGKVASDDLVKLTSLGALLNHNGSISADQGLTLASSRLDNRHGVVNAKGAVSVTTGAFDNTEAGRLISQDRLDLKAGQVRNGNDSRIASDLALTASVTGLEQQGGHLFSKTSLTLDLNHGQLNNQQGLINGPLLVLNNLNEVNNRNGEISSAQAFTLAAKTLDNSAGKLISNQALTLQVEQALANIKGQISAAALQMRSASLDNREGMLSSRGITDVAVDGVLLNQGGSLIGDGQTQLSAAHLDNTDGKVSSKSDLSAQVAQISNQKGLLIAAGTLKLDGDSLDNHKGGLLSATQGLQLKIAELDNRGGEVSSKAGVSLQGQRLDNRDGGQVIAGRALNLTLDEVLNSNKGQLRAQTGLQLSGTRLDNTLGSLTSQGDLELDLGGDLINRQGLLSSEGQASVKAASLDNRQGTLTSAGQIEVTSLGALDNQGGQLVTDAGLKLHSASLDNSHQGTLSSAQALSINTGAFDNSHGGHVASGDTLELQAGRLTNQDAGQITSTKALVARVSALDQQGGKLSSDTSVELDLDHGQLNNQGGLIHGPLLSLKNLKQVNNQGGEISSAQAFTLSAESLDNSGGKLLGNQALTLRIAEVLSNLKGMIAAQSIDGQAASLDNSGGTLTSRSDLLLNINGQLSNRQQGLMDASQRLILNSHGLDNQQGSLSGAVVAIDLGTATGDLNNNAGHITSRGPLTLQHLRDLHNQGGEISTTENLSLAGRLLDNNGGKLISHQGLTLNAEQLNNQGGLMSGWQGVDLKGADLDNRNQGTVSSRYGNLDAHLTNGLLNSGGGALVSQQTLSVSAASLDNSEHGVLSSAAGQVLRVSGQLNNAQGGLIDSGADLELQVQNLDNSAGKVNAQQALSLIGTRLDNSRGTLISKGAVTLDLLGGLINTQGKLGSDQALLLKRATQINNQGGELASNGLLSLLAGSLDNRHQGVVVADRSVTLGIDGAVQNSDGGLIHSQHANLELKAGSLDNSKGSIQSLGALNLDLSGAFDNQSGNLIAQNGDVDLNASSIDNRGGTLSSLKGVLQAKARGGWLRNDLDLNNNRQAGVIQAQALNLISDSFNNHGGRLSAQTGDTLISTGAFDNRDGSLYAKNALKVTGNSFDNGGEVQGQVAAGQVEFKLDGALNNQKGIIESQQSLNISAASVDNRHGQLRALGSGGKSAFQIGGVLDSRAGKLETANSDLSLEVGSFLNQGGSVLHLGAGTFDISSDNLTRAGGTLVTRGGLTLNSDTWTNSSVIQAGRLTLNVNNLSQTAEGQLLASESLVGTGQNWSNDGLIASDGSLNLTLGGTYSGSGRASSKAGLGLSAGQIDLASAGSLAGGGSTAIDVAGQFTNQGRVVSSADLRVNANTLLNQGTLAGAQGLTAKAQSLRNEGSVPGTGALMFSGADMQLQVADLSNNYSDIYSLGALTLGGHSGGRANRLENISGMLESQGNMQLNVQELINRKDKLTYKSEFVSGNIQVVNKYTGTKHRETNYYASDTYRTSVDEDSKSALIHAGGDLTLDGGNIANKYSTISATGNIGISADNLLNEGAVSGESVRTKTWNSGWIKKKSDYAFISNYVVPYNAQSTLTPTSDQAFINYFSGWGGGLRGDVTTTNQLAGSPVAAAVIQAGGAVSINAKQNLINSSVTEYKRPERVSRSGVDTSSGVGAIPAVVKLNAQLAPELAQQQINPLALPGFSLPAGENGLFRLSKQDGSAPAVRAPQDWTMGSALVSVEQHQKSPAATSEPGVRFSDPTLAAASTPEQLQAIGQKVDITTINVSVPVGGDELAGRTTLPSAAVDNQVTTAGSQSISRVQGLPDSLMRSQPHKYLIETNPVLTDLKQFMSSDYLLSNLGYNPDQSAKRLGDGFYEQRLIQQAVTARTGQRFIDGQNSDEKLYKYLMDNAIQSKQQLNLAVGVTLTSEQVAALTHDIVWLENAEVNGEQVLVPVLYLAHSNNRLAPNGALIAGHDLNLVAGKNLDNVGTLRATDNLSAQAGQNLVNSGLVQAGQRLDLLAGNSLVNQAGGIIAGRDVSLTATQGDVLNERTATRLEHQAGEYHHQRDVMDSAARIEAANALSLNAGRDVHNIGSSLKSGTDLSLKAGRDINLASAEQLDNVQRSQRERTQTLTQFGSSVQAGRDLKAEAGRDISAIASQIEATRDIRMTATENLTLASATDEQHSYSKGKRVTSQEDHVRQVATTLVAGGNVALKAGEDLELTASRVTAGNEAYLYAGNDLSLNTAENSDYSYYSKTKTSRSGFSTSRKTRIDSSSSTTQQGSSVSGDTVVIQAGQDIGATASDIVSTHSTSLVAGRNVEIDSATETSEVSHSTSKKKSGLLSSGGIGFTLGSTSAQNTSSSTTENAKASTVGSVLGNVDIQAGKDLTLKGSDVIAGKDISLVGQNVNILAAENHNKSEQTSKTKTGGLTLALSGTVGSAVDTAYQITKQAKEEDDSRLSALQGIKAGLTGVQAWQAAQQGGGMTADNIGQFVGISISLGSQKSSSKQTQEQAVSQGSSLTGGNNLSIVAAGSGVAGADGDIRVQGSQLKAGNNLLLAAERDIQLEAAANRQKLDGKNSSGGGAVGVSLGVGPNGAGLSIFANGNKGTGKEKGTGTTWTETTLDAGNQASLISGRDAALKGAQVNADKITAKVGRDLTLQSLQDTDDYKSKQSNVSGGASFTFGTMTGSASVSVSQSKIDSKYQSVQEQTGLFAGKGGYQVDVGKHTQLDGSVIASTAEADKNRLSTGTLGWSDLKNEAEYKSQMQSASVSSGNGGADGFTSNMPSGMLIAYNHGGSASGTTSSAISSGTLDIRDPGQQKQDVATLSHDVEHANGSISPIFDKEKEQKRLREVQLIGEIGTQVTDIVRTEGQLKADKDASEELEKLGIHRPGKDASKEEVENYQKQLVATDAYKQVMGKYGTGGDYQRVAQAVTAALQGLAGGDIGSALAGASAPYLAQLIKKTTGDNPALNTMAHAVLGAAVAQAQGNSAIAGAAGAAGGELAARLITQQLYGTSDTSSLSEEQKQTVAALSTLAAGLAGGIAKGDSAGAIAGAGAGKNAVENNLLANKYGVEKLNEVSLVALHEKLVAAKIGDMNDLQEKFSACAGEGGCERAVRNEYRQREKESGENLVALYQAGGLSQEELSLLFGKYARIMMEGAKEGQLNSGWGGILGNIYTLNGNDWTPIGAISNPYLAIVRSSEQIAEWKKQGLSDEKIRELSLKDGVISSVLAPVDINGVTNLLNNGASKEELVQFAMIAAFGRVASGSGKLSKATDGSGGSAGQAAKGTGATGEVVAAKDTKATPTEQLALPSPEFNVPGEYRLTRNADGTATVEGPRGGLYNSTGRYTTDGKPVFRDNSGGYVTLDGGRVNVSAPVNYESIPIHHICTNKCTSGANGQIAWTKEYQRFFDGADLNINRATENLVAVPGHRGPHPIEYHQYVYGSLEQATRGLAPRTPAYKEAVTKTLDGIKKEALIVGSDVNKWLTRN